MLHTKTCKSNPNPAAETEQKWFSTGFDELDNICIQTDCAHG
jgi:hypothetical protein